MAFNKIVPVWNAAGVEPPESLKNKGFEAGYKPPAAFFNWFWYGVSEALSELQNNAITENTIETTIETDLNDFITFDHIGLWFCGGTNNVKNKPAGVDSFGVMVIRTATGYFTQVLIAGNKETNKTYVRTYGSGSWTDWKEVAFADGNVASATKLETARKINGIPFDGTEDISVGCIGYEPITSTENDTVANWKALGSGYAVYTNTKLNGQPTDYGFVVQYVYNSLLYQEFHSMPTGGRFYRKGNNTGWWNDPSNKGEWRKVYDELNKPEKLAVARNINGVPFDGSKNIEINPISTLIDQGGDLNNYGALGNIGFWFGAGGNAIKNKPNGVDSFGMLVMRSASGYYTQVLVAGSANTNIMYNRTYNGSTWTAWVPIYSGCNKPTPGEIGAAAKTDSSEMIGMQVEGVYSASDDTTMRLQLRANKDTGVITARVDSKAGTKYPVLYTSENRPTPAIIGAEAVEPARSVAATRNTDNTTGGSIYYRKWKNVVVVSVSNVVIGANVTSANTTYAIASGLPKCSAISHAAICTNSAYVDAFLMIDTNGTQLNIHTRTGTNLANKGIYGQLVYFTNE